MRINNGIEYKFVLCDDDPILCEDLCRQITKYSIQNDLDISIDCFPNGETLYQRMTEQPNYDLLLLDIELGTSNGIEIGRMLRYDLWQSQTDLIYISGKDNYAMQLFENQPFDFLIKPLYYETVKTCLNRYFLYRNREKRFFQYTSDRLKKIVRLQDVLYFECKRNKILIQTTSGAALFHDKFETLSREFVSTEFLRIHKSYLVNIRYIKTIHHDMVELINGKRLTISRSHRNSVQKQLIALSFFAPKFGNTHSCSTKTTSQ